VYSALKGHTVSLTERSTIRYSPLPDVVLTDATIVIYSHYYTCQSTISIHQFIGMRIEMQSIVCIELFYLFGAF
jgi:hypothetical protein